MTDQQRWDSLGCVGGWVETPHLDRIAAEGVRFANAYTNAPACVPARFSLLTGRYPHNHGVWRHMAVTLSRRQPTWLRAIRDAGYRTSVFGKTHLHPQVGDLRDREPLLHAFGFDHVDEIAGPHASVQCRSNLTDRWHEAGVYEVYRRDLSDRSATKPWVARPSPLPLELYPDVYVGRQAAAHLRAEGEGPWFCWVGFSGPHEPWDAPEPYAGRHDPATMPPPVRRQDDRRERPRGLLDRKLARGGVPFAPGDVAQLRANYAGKLSLIDDQVGHILRVVEERRELDRTVLAFVSDHGEMNGDHGLLYKETFLGPAVRIPFVIRLPPHRRRAAAAAVAPALVELMDLGPTLVELAGAEPVAGSLARSAVAVLDDPSRAHRQAVLSELRHEVMLATDEWKIALNRNGEPYLLYDLRADPAEARNVAAMPEYGAIERRLYRRLDRAIRAAR